MWRPATLIRPGGNGYFNDLRSRHCCFDQRFGADLESVCAEIQPLRQFLRKTTHSAVDVGHPTAEEQADQGGKDRRSDVTMMPAHRALLNFTQYATAQNEFVTLLPFLDEAGDF